MRGIGPWTPGLTASTVGLIVLAGVAPVAGHPLGNNSIAHFSILRLYPDRLQIDLFLDMAEEPTTRLLGRVDADGDGEPSASELRSWAIREAERLAGRLSVRVDGVHLPLRACRIDSPEASASLPNAFRFPGFAEGLSTLKVLCRFSARWPAGLSQGSHVLEYEDGTYPDRIGLKRVLLERPERGSGQGPLEGVRIDQHDVRFLDEQDPFAYEQYDPYRMPDERRARVIFRVLGAGSGSARPVHRPGVSSPGTFRVAERFLAAATPQDQLNRYRRQARRIIGLLGAPLSPWVVLLISVFCLGYGAAHALMPGHAKTVVGAYLISQHASYWHAVVLAVTVTFTHTFFVVLVGLIIHWAGAPAGSALQLWLGLGAGATIAAMGLWLAVRGVTGKLDYHHHHHHPHTHTHPGHVGTQTTGPDRGASTGDPLVRGSASSPQRGRITTRQIALLGLSGGMVPCPAATYIMLFAISKNVVGVGLYAVGIFSLGLALALMVVGFLALSSRRFATRLMADARSGQPGERARRWLLRGLPTASGIVVVILGCTIAGHYGYMLCTGRPLIAWLA